MTALAPVLQLFGILTCLLAMWLFLCDRTDEFAPWLFLLALALLGVGLVME
ncbi:MULTISPECIES: hypothetical protein [unclassified Nitrobacter]|uniref:hypothetical protein n=1 Tax=unclassified Nitrobacter TaxID=2620411 RepID=UPI001ACB160D|nr:MULTISPECIES: hypothetical protein [unclassified Nitrobacter]MBN9147255.1 hypothetical protein [Nitrobacter sp.]